MISNFFGYHLDITVVNYIDMISKIISIWYPKNIEKMISDIDDIDSKNIEKISIFLDIFWISYRYQKIDIIHDIDSKNIEKISFFVDIIWISYRYFDIDIIHDIDRENIQERSIFLKIEHLWINFLENAKISENYKHVWFAVCSPTIPPEYIKHCIYDMVIIHTITASQINTNLHLTCNWRLSWALNPEKNDFCFWNRNKVLFVKPFQFLWMNSTSAALFQLNISCAVWQACCKYGISFVHT